MRTLFGIAATLCLAALANASGGADWEIRVSPFQRVFPALELSQAHRHGTPVPGDHVLGSGTGLIAVRVRAHHAAERIVLSLRLPELGPAQDFAATLSEAGVVYELHPPLDWDPALLRRLLRPLTTSLQVRLRRDGGIATMHSVPVSLRPLDEALYFVRDGSDSVDLSWIFAAYVDEHDAVVDRILRAARGNGLAQRFDGYADDDAQAVARQVWAVWQALSERGIRYSGTDPAIERGPHVYTQRVRFLGETWNDRTANCIDGSVLLASVLQRIGLHTYLVLVPGHAFVGYDADAQGRRKRYLETTLLGTRVAAPRRRPRFADDMPLSAEQRTSLAGFSAALAAGGAHYRRIADRLDGRHRPDYAVIDISAARRFGIVPIPSAAEPPDATQMVPGTAPKTSRNAAPPRFSERDTSSVPR